MITERGTDVKRGPPCSFRLTFALTGCIILAVNTFYLSPERYYPRWLTSILQNATRDHAIVLVTGARQVAKSADPWRVAQ